MLRWSEPLVAGMPDMEYGRATASELLRRYSYPEPWKDCGALLGFDEHLTGAGEAVLGGVGVFEDAELVDGVDRRGDVDVDERGWRHVVDTVDGVGGLFGGGSVDDEIGLAEIAGVDLLVGAVDG